MRTQIDAAGRLVLPKAIREAAGVKPGMPLDVTWRDGRIEIVPLVEPPRLVDRRGVLVAEPRGRKRTISAAEIEDLRAKLRDER